MKHNKNECSFSNNNDNNNKFYALKLQIIFVRWIYNCGTEYDTTGGAIARICTSYVT